MIAALEAAGNEVVPCQVNLWHSIEDRVDTTKGGWKKPTFWWRVLRTYLRLIGQFVWVRDFDVLMVGYPGQFDIFLAKFFSILRRKPLVWDVFMSIYLVAKERGLHRESPFTVKLIRWFEARALRLPDRLIQDTAQYVTWFESEYKLLPDRFRLVPTGADDRIFTPLPTSSNATTDNEFIVLYYGTFIPNHGVMKIAEAVYQLSSQTDIIFEFIGDGPERSKFETYLHDHNLHNTRLFRWMSQEKLLEKIMAAHVCLGAFGDTPQSLMTVQNKIYECMAMGKPIITGKSPATQNNLPADTLVLCSRDSSHEIADAILALKGNPEWRKRLSHQAITVFNQSYSIIRLGQTMTEHLEELLSSKKKAK